MGKTFDIYDIGLVLDVTSEYDAYRQEAKTGIDALLLEALPNCIESKTNKKSYISYYTTFFDRCQ